MHEGVARQKRENMLFVEKTATSRNVDLVVAGKILGPYLFCKSLALHKKVQKTTRIVAKNSPSISS
jgi:hypothetical protein